MNPSRPPVSRILELEGCPLAYDVRGSGPPVLWLQGVGVHGDGWRPQVDELSSRWRCLTLDNRGLGRSRPAGTEITVERMARDALAVLDAESIDVAHVVGHSLGGLVALRTALEARERVASLALVCTFADGRAVAPLTPRMMWLGARSRIGSRAGRRRAFLRLVMPDEALEREDVAALAQRLEPIFGHDLADSPPVVGDQLRAMRRASVVARLAELADLPTLVVSGAHDPIAPSRLGAAIAAGIRGAHHVEFDDASHGLPIQHPARINALLAEHFLSARDGTIRGLGVNARPGSR